MLDSHTSEILPHLEPKRFGKFVDQVIQWPPDLFDHLTVTSARWETVTFPTGLSSGHLTIVPKRARNDRGAILPQDAQKTWNDRNDPCFALKNALFSEGLTFKNRGVIWVLGWIFVQLFTWSLGFGFSAKKGREANRFDSAAGNFSRVSFREEFHLFFGRA